MSTLYLDHRELRLKRESQAIAIYQSGERHGTVPMRMLERLVIRGSVALDTGLLGTLAERGVSILIQSGRQGRAQAMLLGGGHGDASRRIAQYRLYLSADWRRAWARYLVTHKLLGHLRLLRRAQRRRPDLRKPLHDGQQQIGGLLDTLRSPDAPLDLESLRGLEGAGAAAFFAAFVHLFPAQLDFSGRNRRPPRDPVNACLSLAYTLMHFEAARACHAAGLDPLIGFYHEPAHGRESLAADCLEPLRPRIDEWVWRLFRRRVLEAAHFHRDQGACLLGKAGRQHFYAYYEPFARPLRRLLRRALGRAVRLVIERGADP